MCHFFKPLSFIDFVMQLSLEKSGMYQYYRMFTACVVVNVWVGEPGYVHRIHTNCQCHHGAIVSHVKLYKTKAFLPKAVTQT